MLIHFDLEGEVVAYSSGVTLNKMRVLGVMVVEVNCDETHHLGDLLYFILRIVHNSALVQSQLPQEHIEVVLLLT